MTDKPIITPAIRIPALREGRMTQMRVPLDPQPKGVSFCGILLDENIALFDHGLGYVIIRGCEKIPLPYSIGDRLRVPEDWNLFQFSQDGDEAWPEAEIPTPEEMKEAEELGHRYGAPQVVFRESERARKWFSDQPWRSAVTMPRWASRTTLVVNDVRVQRVQEITEADARAEGVTGMTWPAYGTTNVTNVNYRKPFRDLWNTLHGPDAWDRNDWIAAYSFDVHLCNIDQMPGDV